MAAAAELRDHIERTTPVIGYCASARSSTYRGASGDLTVMELDETDVDLVGFGATEYADWSEPGPLDRAAVMFTSGTTGRPKGVEITQANYAFAGTTMAAAAALGPDDRQLVVLPLFHANAQYYSFASAIAVGASVALMPSFSASGFLPQAARHEATCASLFAAPIRMILARGGPVDGLVLRHCWYAQNVSRDQHDIVTEWFGCPPRQLYGMTETIPAVLTDEAGVPDPASMGRVTPGCDVDVQRSDGSSVASGEVGEVVVRGVPGHTLFAGYLDAPDLTAGSFRNGWFLTGDRATRDETGRHFFDGRRSDVLKVAGENVSIVEVESVLADHPGVLEAAVVGRPDPIRDEVPVAFVVAADPHATPAPAELAAWCETRLGKAKRPHAFHVLPELPRTSVGKIRKFLLAEQAIESQEVTT
jgi:crotonobetaine/carnitine-CoA ligase